MGQRTMGRLSAVGVWLAALGMGCSSDPVVTDSGVRADVGGGDVPVMGDVPATGPTVRVVTPAAGTMFPVGASTSITVAVTNFMLEDFPRMGSAMVPGRGHFHVYLDNFDDNDYLFADFRTTVPIVIPPGTPAGMHSLRVSLRNHDHSPIGARGSVSEVTLPVMVVVQTGPSVSIGQPVDNTTVMAGATLMFSISVMNFMLVAPSAMNMAGRGHYAVYLDDGSGSDRIATEAVMTNFGATIPMGTTPGPHRVRVSLRQNDESPVPGFPEAALRITVN